MGNYLNLIRFYNQSGTLLLYANCLLGLLVGGMFASFPEYTLFIKFFLGAFFARSAGCVINDILDRKIDAKVERTKNRPLANNSLSVKKAIFVLILMLFGGLLVLLTLPFEVFIVCSISLVFIFTYPLFKRFSNLPQLFLGITYGIAFFASFFAVYNQFSLKILPLYFALILWTIIFDTIYAMQDLKDDLKIGVKSTAVLFNKKYKMFLYFINIAYFMSVLIFWHLMNLKFIIFPALSFLLTTFLIKNSNNKTFFKMFKNNFFVIIFLCIGLLFNYL